MKITVDIECSPKEARETLGLPDVEAFNKRVMDEMMKRVDQGFDPQQMDKLFKDWSEAALSGMGTWQKSFFSLMQQAAKTDG